ncbi:MAG: hypothetical protein EZS28_016674 [Streblomastix strix]|uniref:Uncharacterized protein n=1 Tax=Streblomastix strix TaxID=222440 RepID=A0A5J4VZX2_9EUKA|nr:MAG: hypothetical protein EZS28_016674 [Streblomastix strix]
MYDQNWYNCRDIVPDQVTPASDATPLSDGSANAGTSTEYSRGDHVDTLTFNGSVIAGAGASISGESSVTYSQCKAVQWGINSSQSGVAAN